MMYSYVIKFHKLFNPSLYPENQWPCLERNWIFAFSKMHRLNNLDKQYNLSKYTQRKQNLLLKKASKLRTCNSQRQHKHIVSNMFLVYGYCHFVFKIPILCFLFCPNCSFEACFKAMPFEEEFFLLFFGVISCLTFLKMQSYKCCLKSET